jgi:hypothetical protein
MGEEERVQCVGIGHFATEPPFEVFAGLTPSREVYENYRLGLYLPEFLNQYRKQLCKLDVNVVGKVLSNRIMLYDYDANGITLPWLSVLINWLRNAGFDVVNYQDILDAKEGD